jgi:hypothetical protein
MATYRLKRRLFSLGATAGKALNVLGGGDSKNISTMNKVFGGMSVAGMVSTAKSGNQERAENAAQMKQTLAEQKERLNQLENIAKS